MLDEGEKIDYTIIDIEGTEQVEHSSGARAAAAAFSCGFFQMYICAGGVVRSLLISFLPRSHTVGGYIQLRNGVKNMSTRTYGGGGEKRSDLEVVLVFLALLFIIAVSK